jgi:hypothetical protein
MGEYGAGLVERGYNNNGSANKVMGNGTASPFWKNIATLASIFNASIRLQVG